MPARTRTVTRRQAAHALAGLGLWPGLTARAADTPRVLTVAAFPAVDKIVAAAAPAWARLHPGVALKVVSRQFADHHTAMTTALATSVYLPDVMAPEPGCVGRFAQGGGLEGLGQPPDDISPDPLLLRTDRHAQPSDGPSS